MTRKNPERTAAAKTPETTASVARTVVEQAAIEAVRKFVDTVDERSPQRKATHRDGRT
jgi:hypothetical protein